MSLSRRQFLELGAAGASALLTVGWWRQAAAAPLPPRGDVRLALISDLNASYGSTNYIPQVHRGVQLLQALRPDLVLCGGDMVAGQKLGLGSGHLDAMWASFERQVLQPVLRGSGGFAPTMGNHDASSSRGPGGFTFALDRERAGHFWRARQQRLGLELVDAARFPFRYSLRRGPVFLVVLDASSASVPAEDWAWARSQLSGAAARQARLRLVMGHLPPYGVGLGRDRPGEVLHQPEQLRQLMAATGCHLYVSGHHHAYFPGVSGGMNLLSLGAMGSGPRRRLNDATPPEQTLTVLDLFEQRGEVVETTLELNTLQVVRPASLPLALQPSTGPRLQRRELPLKLAAPT
ncbi:metallophosphoesterase [Cyanobium sp. CH-040]|uniref:metallophosphoesterase family protein n=1 Tax=Cyanobium sp. CH-040 TaxID=2823708 RepID=UPI0020CC0648|nr:metallophosphoesterase [Cyanobium sp. CH-040]MCP9929046.1 metallophosphoesterase [Cyanobium sp. CH-040]